MKTKDIKSNSVLWIGNGLNRTFKGDSWKEIIKNICHKNKNASICPENIYPLPYNLQIVAASEDCVDAEMNKLAETMRDSEISDDMCTFIRENLLTIPIDNIITTNYTYELEKTINPSYSTHFSNRARKKVIDGNERQNQFMIYRYNEVGDKKIWHIHGEACTPSTVIMGQYYYGKLVFTIQEYLSHRMGVLKHCYKNNIDIKNPSYIDLFLTKDVYVMGFGMDFSEIDFWWLACCKKRNFPETKIYVYEPDVSKVDAKRLVGEAYGIQFVGPQSVDSGEDGYKKYWKEITDELKELLSEI